MTRSASLSVRRYNHWVVRIPFFRGLGEQTRTLLCRLVENVSVAKDTEVLNEGDATTEMFFIIAGEVEVERAGTSLGFLTEGERATTRRML